MARQAGDIFIEGTIDDLTFYKMEGKYYVRTKSSLTAKRFWKAKCFERSRKSCSRFGEGNKLASKVYGMIEEEKKVNKLFAFLRAKAISLLKEERSSGEVVQLLLDYLIDFGFIAVEPFRKEDVQTRERVEKRRSNVTGASTKAGQSEEDTDCSYDSFDFRLSFQGFNSS